jgi:hypothetical protein
MGLADFIVINIFSFINSNFELHDFLDLKSAIHPWLFKKLSKFGRNYNVNSLVNLLYAA